MGYYCQLVQDCPPDLRRKVSRIVGAKCTLAARVDSFHQSNDGACGMDYREEILKKVDKMKERYAVTELRKQANRMTFGELEEDLYQNDLGYTRGNIGKGGIGGGIRSAQVDERTKVRISQTLKKNLQKQQAVWGGTSSIKKHVSGTASSVAFTPVQGLEIVNPMAAEKKVDEANQKYFSTTSGFLSVKRSSIG